MARIIFALACVVTLACCGDATAQRRTPGFVKKPTISPYVNLFRSNSGGLSSYFTFVRPEIEAQQFMQRQSQQSALNRVAIQQEMLQLQQALPGSQSATLQQRPSSASTNGTVRRPAGRFMSFGTFFPSNNATPSTRRR